ncbi:MAG TPA: class I SAM-dependent methyltransferase [Rugosimonospora sp.]|nr:class I SAM-dependent methyltransferase [Rugosimonospora sp.]
MHPHPLVPVYSPELFRGTAEYYARFRPRYPPALLDAIAQTVGLDQGDTLLDLACGTGDVCLALADRISEIWAIDLEPEMVAVGQRRAAERGIARIHWLVGRAEDAPLPEDHCGLVTVGRAFHRLNRPLIARQCRRWLRRGGHFIDLGADSSVPFLRTEPWLAAVAEVYERWLPRAHRSRAEVTSSAGPDQPVATTRAVLADAGFTGVAEYQFPVPYVWEIDQYLGYLCSTSYSSRRFWGGAWDGFARDLRDTLAGYAPEGQLTETISAYFVVGRNP